jgi:hypothetical protein
LISNRIELGSPSSIIEILDCLKVLLRMPEGDIQEFRVETAAFSRL